MSFSHIYLISWIFLLKLIHSLFRNIFFLSNSDKLSHNIQNYILNFYLRNKFGTGIKFFLKVCNSSKYFY